MHGVGIQFQNSVNLVRFGRSIHQNTLEFDAEFKYAYPQSLPFPQPLYISNLQFFQTSTFQFIIYSSHWTKPQGMHLPVTGAFLIYLQCHGMGSRTLSSLPFPAIIPSIYSITGVKAMGPNNRCFFQQPALSSSSSSAVVWDPSLILCPNQ